MNKRVLQSAAIPVLVITVLAFVLWSNQRSEPKKHTYPELIQAIDKKQIKKIEVEPTSNRIVVTPVSKKEEPYSIGFATEKDLDELTAQLKASDQYDIYSVKPTEQRSMIAYVLSSILPVGLLILFFVWMANSAQGAGGKMLGFGKSRARQVSPDAPRVTFRDVAGADEAVEELHEIKEFLENPKKFQSLGARIPKGVLLFGPPGTGKTLLARATAGEAGVPFFSISGSDFVEMFVGVGASRVRDLFEQAKLHSPCIVFVDEIDAVGRHRGAGLGNGNDEREQTLNQLLVEMDGFEMKDNIIIVAATNRPDILDPALLRPGRFDRQIRVDAPDRPGRESIIKVHTKGKPLARDVRIDKLAGQTPGFTGADLANLVNEAALLSARRGRKTIGMSELEEGIMRVIAGPEKKARLMSERDRRVTAVHEMGHALCAHFIEHADPVHKISVVGRGMALGYVVSMPTEDKFTRRRVELMAKLAQALGGRTAEEIIFHEITTGAESDLKTVTQTAKRMVMQWGMSEKLGPRQFGSDHDHPFLGRDFSGEPDYSDALAREIDDEIKLIIEEAHDLARSVLEDHRHQLEQLSEVLMEHETIDSEQFARLLAGESAADVFGDVPDNDVPARETKPRSVAPVPRPELGTESFVDTTDDPGTGPISS